MNKEKTINMLNIPDKEALEMLRAIAVDSLRPMGAQAAWMFRQEYEIRFKSEVLLAKHKVTK